MARRMASARSAGQDPSDGTGYSENLSPLESHKTFSVQSPLSARSLEKLEKSPRDIFHPEIQKDLLVLEEQEGSVNFKFGVLCAMDGQLTDDEMFSHVFAGALLTQALGKTSFGFLLSHWELPSFVASGEIHPEPLQNQLKPRESHSQLSQDTRRRMGDISEHLASALLSKLGL
ncbi:GTPase-activating Rap/Ran-GAP domain-like protein 3 isoform X2 [Agelaius tricolor]|uniref:GTPase-activating Rap/Ran-GAP domain-like protein 3 isoform X2 n=1 Tax=Agelaius tricolor TaxID=9191 RepID=UPI0039F1ADBB